MINHHKKSSRKDIEEIINQLQNDSRGKLMYYLYNLNQIMDLSEISPEILKYTNYENYLLDNNDIKILFNYCGILSPMKLDNSCIVKSSDPSLSNSIVLYDVNDVDPLYVKYKNFRIVNKKMNVHHVLVYKEPWIEEFYYKPMSYITKRMDIISTPKMTYTVNTINSNKSPSSTLTSILSEFQIKYNDNYRIPVYLFL